MDWLAQIDVLCRDYLTPEQAADLRYYVETDFTDGWVEPVLVPNFWNDPQPEAEWLELFLVVSHNKKRVDVYHYNWLTGGLFTRSINDRVRYHQYCQLVRIQKLQRILQ